MLADHKHRAKRRFVVEVPNPLAPGNTCYVDVSICSCGARRESPVRAAGPQRGRWVEIGGAR